MKIVVITGSHHKNGTSAHLAAAFIRGAEETGHEVCRFDAAFRQVHPCIACETCHNTDRGCAFADDMKTLYGTAGSGCGCLCNADLLLCNECTDPGSH